MHCVHEINYAWNHTACVGKCDKGCHLGEYSKDCTCIKTIFDVLVLTHHETVEAPDGVVINPRNRTNY